jgi:hypothetical protein
MANEDLTGKLIINNSERSLTNFNANNFMLLILKGNNNNIKRLLIKIQIEWQYAWVLGFQEWINEEGRTIQVYLFAS